MVYKVSHDMLKMFTLLNILKYVQSKIATSVIEFKIYHMHYHMHHLWSLSDLIKNTFLKIKIKS